MKRNKSRKWIIGMLAACMAAFSVSASAAAYYASDESGKKVPPGSIDSIRIMFTAQTGSTHTGFWKIR